MALFHSTYITGDITTLARDAADLIEAETLNHAAQRVIAINAPATTLHAIGKNDHAVVLQGMDMMLLLTFTIVVTPANV